MWQPWLVSEEEPGKDAEATESLFIVVLDRVIDKLKRFCIGVQKWRVMIR